PYYPQAYSVSPQPSAQHSRQPSFQYSSISNVSSPNPSSNNGPASPAMSTHSNISTGLSEPGPPSALPSQFAQNLPSPSTFYPEFYQQNELPSPLNFNSTPVAANNNGNSNAFPWPPGGQRDYRPSPLKPELLDNKRGFEENNDTERTNLKKPKS
ncbi:hypothetical protein CU098_000212, partial [Rhizopus stolonifer]